MQFNSDAHSAKSDPTMMKFCYLLLLPSLVIALMSALTDAYTASGKVLLTVTRQLLSFISSSLFIGLNLSVLSINRKRFFQIFLSDNIYSVAVLVFLFRRSISVFDFQYLFNRVFVGCFFFSSNFISIIVYLFAKRKSSNISLIIRFSPIHVLH